MAAISFVRILVRQASLSVGQSTEHNVSSEPNGPFMMKQIARTVSFTLYQTWSDTPGQKVCPLLKYEADDVMNPLEHRTMADSSGFPPFTPWNTGTSAHR